MKRLKGKSFLPKRPSKFVGVPWATGYSANAEGVVFGVLGRRIGARPNKQGYCNIRLFKGGEAWGVHRLVWTLFVGSIPEDREINHIDGNKSNNHLRNLELVTRSQNQKHAIDTGLKTVLRGEHVAKATITERDALKIIGYINDGYDNAWIATKLSTEDFVVSEIRRGTTWKHLVREQGNASTRVRKVSVDERRKIIGLILRGRPRMLLAEQFGVSKTLIAMAEKRKIWPNEWATLDKQWRRQKPSL